MRDSVKLENKYEGKNDIRKLVGNDYNTCTWGCLQYSHCH